MALTTPARAGLALAAGCAALLTAACSAATLTPAAHTAAKQALSASRAWLVTPGRGSQTWIYATADGGRIWRRIDPEARAAG